MYFDIHTHHFKNLPNVSSIENISSDFASIQSDRKVSLGLHPWYLKAESWQDDFAVLRRYAERAEVLAIGECGLDRICEIDFDLQTLVFDKQIQLAEALRKPLIIHCVKAFSECLAKLKNVNVPVIFHGINNKLSTVQPVIDGHYHLSFGKALLSSNEAIQYTFKKTPLTQLFLETNDTEIDIREIYKLAAQIKNIEEKEIVLQLERNFITVFGN